MSFFSILLWAGPLAVVLGVALGHFLPWQKRQRGNAATSKLSSHEIHDLLLSETDIRTIRAALAELRRRGESFSFAEPRLIDMSKNANRMISISAQEVLNDYFSTSPSKSSRGADRWSVPLRDSAAPSDTLGT